jgi:hypothetical protein
MQILCYNVNTVPALFHLLADQRRVKMEDLRKKMNDLLDFEGASEKMPKAIGGLLAAFGGFLAFVGFFLKWQVWSGLKTATDGDATFLCLVPLLGLLIILVGLAAAAVPFLRREVPLLKPVAGGLLTLLSVILLCPIFFELGDNAGIGWWCAPLGALLIAVGAVVALVLPSIIGKDVS